MHTHSNKLSNQLQRIKDVAASNSLTIGTLVETLQSEGHLLVCIIFAAPFLLPIPLPGLSTVFGAVIILAALQELFAIRPRIPKRFSNKEVSSSIVIQITEKLLWLAKKLERVIKPRFVHLAESTVVDKTTSIHLLLLAILLSLPMPPGFNAPPAFSIIILAIAHLEADFIFIVLGWVLATINYALFSLAFYFGFDGLNAIVHKFFGGSQ